MNGGCPAAGLQVVLVGGSGGQLKYKKVFFMTSEHGLSWRLIQHYMPGRSQIPTRLEDNISLLQGEYKLYSNDLTTALLARMCGCSWP